MKTQFRFLFVVLFSTLLATSTLAQSGLSSERLDRYDAFYQKEIDEGRLPGVVTLIYKNGEMAHESALGYSNFASETPMQTDQIFFIQSMTKPIMSTAFMMLYEEGYSS